MSEKHTTRRQQKAGKSSATSSDSSDVPLAQPDRSGPKGKSLLDLAAERQDELIAQADAINEKRRQASDGIKSTEGPFANALLYAVTLSMVHFTLDVLVYHQYAQKIYWDEIFGRLGLFFPCVGAIIYILYQPFIMRLPLLRQVAFLVASTLAGCYLARTSNKETYIAVMRRAPPLGTLMVWLYIEMRLPFALAGLGFIGGYMWINRYLLF